jgi:hypothetical protein
MPDIITGATAFSAISGAKSAKKSRKIDQQGVDIARERDAYNKDIVEDQNRFTREDREYYDTRRTREEGLLDPIQEGLVERAAAGPDYEGAISRSDADVEQAYGLTRAEEQRRMDRYGINPASGKASSISRRVGNAKALAKVYGRSKARRDEDDRDWARKIAVLGTGNMRGTTGPRQLTQLGVSQTGPALDRASGTASSNAAGAFGLAGKLFADSRRDSGGYVANDDTDYFTGD